MRAGHGLYAGIHGEAGPPPAAQPAAAPMPAASGEPQLTLRGARGARRWGPAHFEAAPAAAPAAAASARPPAAGMIAACSMYLAFVVRSQLEHQSCQNQLTVS